MATRLFLLYDPARPIRFPPCCCVCLAPTVTTHRLWAARHRRRTGPHSTVTSNVPFDIPYCEPHARQARLCAAIDRLATVAFFALSVIALIWLVVAINPALRGMNDTVIWPIRVGLTLAVALTGFLLYRTAMGGVRAVYPPMRDFSLTGALGIHIGIALLTRRYPLPLAVTVTNDEFGRHLADLNADLVTKNPVGDA
jgi:hypothetical protein